MELLLEGKGQRWNAVIQGRHGDNQARLHRQPAVKRAAVQVVDRAETVLHPVVTGQQRLGVDFADLQDKPVGVVPHQIPGVAGEFPFHIGQKAGRAEEAEVFFTAEKQPQKMVEAEEVVHVGVGHEHMADLEGLSGGEGVKIPEIEEEGALLEQKGDEEGWIPKGAVDQPGVK